MAMAASMRGQIFKLLQDLPPRDGDPNSRLELEVRLGRVSNSSTTTTPMGPTADSLRAKSAGDDIHIHHGDRFQAGIPPEWEGRLTQTLQKEEFKEAKPSIDTVTTWDNYRHVAMPSGRHYFELKEPARPPVDLIAPCFAADLRISLAWETPVSARVGESAKAKATTTTTTRTRSRRNWETQHWIVSVTGVQYNGSDDELHLEVEWRHDAATALPHHDAIQELIRLLYVLVPPNAHPFRPTLPVISNLDLQRNLQATIDACRVPVAVMCHASPPPKPLRRRNLDAMVAASAARFEKVKVLPQPRGVPIALVVSGNRIGGIVCGGGGGGGDDDDDDHHMAFVECPELRAPTESTTAAGNHQCVLMATMAWCTNSQKAVAIVHDAYFPIITSCHEERMKMAKEAVAAFEGIYVVCDDFVPTAKDTMGATQIGRHCVEISTFICTYKNVKYRWTSASDESASFSTAAEQLAWDEVVFALGCLKE